MNRISTKLNSIFLVLSVLLLSLHAEATVYYLKGTGNITTASSWNTAMDGSGTNAGGFGGSSDEWHFMNRTSATLGQPFATPSTATVIIESGFNLTVNTNGPTGGLFNAYINIASGGTVTVSNNNNYTWNTLHANSTVIFNNSSATIKPANYGNIIINQSTSINGSGTVWLFGKLTINSGLTFNLAGQGLFLQGSSGLVAGTGSITGHVNSYIALYGGNGGDNGTLYFSSTNNSLNTLLIAHDATTDFVRLGTDLNIVNGGAFRQNYGSIDFNGKTITIDASSDINFIPASTDGVIFASNSKLFINGTVGGITGQPDMFVDGSNNTFAVVALNKSGTSLKFSSPLSISDSVSVLAGNLDFNGNLKLNAAASVKGRLGRVGGTIMGNYTVDTYIPNGSAGWANLGIPGVASQNVVSWDAGSNTPGIPMTCTGCFYSPSLVGGFTSIQGWSETTNNYVPSSGTDPLTVGKGFWVYVASNLSTATDYTLRNTGPAVTGNTTIAITKNSSGYNLVANPYASPISWDKARINSGTTATFSSNATYMYSADQSVHISYVNGASSNGGSAIIPAGQGFYVEALTAGNLEFDEEDKIASNTGSIKKPAASGAYGLIFYLDIAGSGKKDQATFRIHQNATPLFDGAWDAHKLYPSLSGMFQQGGPKFLSICSQDITNEEYSINSLPLLTQNVTIPLKVKFPGTGSYSISLSEEDAINTCYKLYDNDLNVTHDLKTGPYTFTSSDSSFSSRFELRLCQDPNAGTVGVASLLTESNVFISQDGEGMFVRSRFDKNTTSQISAYNIVGQKLMSDITVHGTENTTRLPLDVNNQVVIIKVVSDQGIVTKKIIKH